MITLALDEAGEFEKKSTTPRPAMIAGLIYDDKGNIDDTRRERERIEAYYRQVIESVDDGLSYFDFPAALHSNGNKDRDKKVVGPVKRRVNGTIREFLEKGTYEGRELLSIKTKRKGCYYIFALLKCGTGMSFLLGPDVNFMLKDDYASNLYFHMVSRVVTRVLFHNPIIHNIERISMNIATRRTEDMNVNSPRAIEYRKQGYRNNNVHDDTVYFGIANADIYRGVFSQEMLRTGKTDLVVDDFDVKPINYHNNQNMEFLYLADHICSYLFRHLEDHADSSYDWLTKVDAKATQINATDHNLIFAYDEIDESYNRAVEAYENGDIYRALEIIFDASVLPKNEIVQYYNRKWFKELTTAICGVRSEKAFIEAVEKLHRSITTNELNPNKAVYILHTLEKLGAKIEENMDDAESRATMYQLYDAGVSFYCHVGDSQRVIQYFNKCKKFVYRVSVEDYLVTLNRIIGTFLDSFEWNRAKKVAADSVLYQKKLLSMRNTLPVFQIYNQKETIGLSKAISQQAQVYACLRNPGCEELFRRALSSFPLESANYKITQSYLLHYYLDMGMHDKYEREATLYFGGKDNPSERFEYIMKEAFKDTPIINYNYALYVFLRGLYLFEKDDISDALRNDIYEIDTTIKRYEQKEKGKRNSSFDFLSGHPSELIMKYLALIAYDNGDIRRWEQFYQEIESEKRIRYFGPTICLVRIFAQAECRHIIGDYQNRNQLIQDFIDRARSHFEHFRKLDIPEDPDERYMLIQKHMSYMYC